MSRQILVYVILYLQGTVATTVLTTIENVSTLNSTVSPVVSSISNNSTTLIITKVQNNTGKVTTAKSYNNSIEVKKKKIRPDTSIPKMDDGIPDTFYNITADVDGVDVVFRVVNGEIAKLGTVPYQVGFYALTAQRYRLSEEELGVDVNFGFGKKPSRYSNKNYSAFCGGTLVTRSKIITAAHCFVKDRASNCLQGTLSQSSFRNMYAIMATEYTTIPYASTRRDKSQWRLLRRGAYPRDYKFPKSDICVVHTSRPFNLNSYVGTLPYLRKKPKDFTGMECTISGFGRISNNVQTKVLRYGKAKVLPRDVCRKIHRQDMSKFLCTSDVPSDVHKGDSGGPLACQGQLAGVVSGKVLTLKSSAFFTRVDSYQSFLRNRSFNNMSNFCFLLFVLLINSVLSTDLVS